MTTQWYKFDSLGDNSGILIQDESFNCLVDQAGLGDKSIANFFEGGSSQSVLFVEFG